jgi:hypothetical protein
MAKLGARLELRLDKQTYAELERCATARQVTVAQLVRQAITRELGAGGRSWRQLALEEALALGIPVPQDPAELARELDEAYEVPAAGGRRRR